MEVKIKTFLDKQKLRNFVISRPAIQEMFLKGYLAKEK